MKKTVIMLLTAVMTGSLAAQTAQEAFRQNRYLSASNYLDYDRQQSTTPLTPAPKGYEPFYLSHYGRHGSRWLIVKADYTGPLETLREAHAAGKLTAEGEGVLQVLEQLYPTTVDRLGELTTVGERQHHGIGSRMARNFPEIFKSKNVPIDARSTVVIRCILSMEAECEEIAAANPTARFHNDVSESLQYYLNQPWSNRLKEQSRKGKPLLKSYRQQLTHPERLMKVLFNDQGWVFSNVNAGGLMRNLFQIAANMQSHDTSLELYSLFTDDEVYDQWRWRNIGWYLDYGHAPQTGASMPFSQLNLLKNIIETADTVSQRQATLRFGHEVCVMPLACLLELGQCGTQVENLDTLDHVWRDYQIFPMACNVQLVFYRPKKSAAAIGQGDNSDILVKALLNEREVTLPAVPVSGPYYRWQDLRQYYLKKIAEYENQE